MGLCFRNLWSEAGRDSSIWTTLWQQNGSHAGGAVRGLHPPLGSPRGRALPFAWTSQPRQRASGCFRLWREAVFRLVLALNTFIVSVMNMKWICVNADVHNFKSSKASHSDFLYYLACLSYLLSPVCFFVSGACTLRDVIVMEDFNEVLVVNRWTGS